MWTTTTAKNYYYYHHRCTPLYYNSILVTHLWREMGFGGRLVEECGHEVKCERRNRKMMIMEGRKSSSFQGWWSFPFVSFTSFHQLKFSLRLSLNCSFGNGLPECQHTYTRLTLRIWQRNVGPLLATTMLRYECLGSRRMYNSCKWKALSFVLFSMRATNSSFFLPYEHASTLHT